MKITVQIDLDSTKNKEETTAMLSFLSKLSFGSGAMVEQPFEPEPEPEPESKAPAKRGPGRPRKAAEPEPEPEPEPEEDEEKEITDDDLRAACAAKASELGKPDGRKLVKEWMAQNYKVAVVPDIPKDKRAEFIQALAKIRKTQKGAK